MRLSKVMLKLATQVLIVCCAGANLIGCSNPAEGNKDQAALHTETDAITSKTASARTLVLSKSDYDVALKPSTQVIDAAVMHHAYRGANSDGALTFDASAAPALRELKTGSVVVFAGVALLKVSKVIASGDTIAVSGTRAGLEDAVDHGHIAWSAPLDFAKVAFNPPAGFHRVAGPSGPLLALSNFLASPAQASAADNIWKGSVKEWDVTTALTLSNGDLHLDFDASKSIVGGTIDVHGVGQFNGFSNEGSITLSNGATTEVTFNNKSISGTVDFIWKVAFDADHGGGNPKLSESDVENLPFSLDFPIPLGPIPFVLSFKTGFAFQPAFTSKVAVAQGTYHSSFGGNVPMTASADTPAAAEGAAAAAASSTRSVGLTRFF